MEHEFLKLPLITEGATVKELYFVWSLKSIYYKNLCCNEQKYFLNTVETVEVRTNYFLNC
jgi:hypothetical protein